MDRRRIGNALLALAVGLGLLACRAGEAPPAPGRPTGTPTDPVAVCERAADVCRLDGARLGVCTAASADRCPGPAPCYVCMSQH